MCSKNVKNVKFVAIIISSSKCTKTRFRPRRGSYIAPPDPIIGRGGRQPLPIPFSPGRSILARFQTEFLATPATSKKSENCWIRTFYRPNTCYYRSYAQPTALKQGVYKFNSTNFQEISRRLQEGFQEKSRTCLHCFGLLCNVILFTL